MDAEKLNKANELDSKIKDCDIVINCFEYTVSNNEGVNEIISTHPILMIEHDDEVGNRMITKLPVILNDAIIEVLKTRIRIEKERLNKEFHNL